MDCIKIVKEFKLGGAIKFIDLNIGDTFQYKDRIATKTKFFTENNLPIAFEIGTFNNIFLEEDDFLKRDFLVIKLIPIN